MTSLNTVFSIALPPRDPSLSIYSSAVPGSDRMAIHRLARPTHPSTNSSHDRDRSFCPLKFVGVQALFALFALFVNAGLILSEEVSEQPKLTRRDFQAFTQDVHLEGSPPFPFI